MVLGLKEGLVECATVCVKSVVILTTEWEFEFTGESLYNKVKNWKQQINKKLAPLKTTGAGVEAIVRSALEPYEYIIYECMINAKRNPMYKVSK